MTDPVDTDALREAYSAAYGPARRAWMNDADAHTEGLKAVARAVIENAPHDVGCASPAESLLGVARDPERPCTCWKADAL
ncbi:hypothetical protein [Curtobacterium poinsettiae]|uniref:hypothetical protein n=1 Tax=Curtobacterium poinsettiae TaxID=159612 RepID=UPI00217DBA3C|nr:hypothetical protein [Curtobacterium flaccumfaciens]MCS6578273.1 hypothetical protein [Curtobacterium flaccumfaciens]